MHSSLLGIPYLYKGRSITGTDCWGLVRLSYQLDLNIELPSFDEFYTSCKSHRKIRVNHVLSRLHGFCGVSYLGDHTIVLGILDFMFGFGVWYPGFGVLAIENGASSRVIGWEDWVNRWDKVMFFERSKASE